VTAGTGWLSLAGQPSFYRTDRTRNAPSTAGTAMPRPVQRVCARCSVDGTVRKIRCGAAICNRLMRVTFSS